jgi:hypothetical protein
MSFAAFIALLLCVVQYTIALSMRPSSVSAPSLPQTFRPRSPLGTMRRPLDKSRVAVVGAGGDLGASIFGLLQRASALYECGLSTKTAPRAICATSFGSGALNSRLGGAFKLAVATEDKVALTNLQSVEALGRRLANFDYVVLPVEWGLSQARVTASTYEKGPNDMTVEAFFQAGSGEGEAYDADTSASIFGNVLKAAAGARSHMVVVGTGQREKDDEAIRSLEASKGTYTFLRPQAEMFSQPIGWTYEVGLSNLLLGKVEKEGEEVAAVEGGSEMRSTDLAGFVVAAIMSLDPEESRVLSVYDSGITR